MVMVKAWQYRTVLGRRVPFGKMLRIMIWQIVTSNLIANSMGIAAYMAFLQAEAGVNWAYSGAAFSLVKFSDLLVLSILLGVSLILLWAQIPSGFQIVGLLLLSGAIILLLLVMLLVRGHVLWIAWLTRLPRRRTFARPLIEKITDFGQWLSRQPFDLIWRKIQKISLWSGLYFLLTMGFAYSNLRMFRVHIDFVEVVFVNTFLQFLSFLPIQILGGLGVTEVTSAYLYHSFGFNLGEISAVLLGLRVVFSLMNVALLAGIPLLSVVQPKIKQGRIAFWISQRRDDG